MKKFLATLLVAIMLVSLFACGDETTLDDLLDSLESLDSSTSSQNEENSSHAEGQEDMSQADGSQVDGGQTDSIQSDGSQAEGDQATETPEEIDDDNSVYFSTNDLETAKNGNSGVFAYKKGGSYDIYYIVNFDEGYVYRFIDGNGDETCDRLKIDSGDLNSILIVTYHSGNDSWQNGLHFKWKNQPDIMILEDGYDEYRFTTTDLDDALAIRDTKTITDY